MEKRTEEKTMYLFKKPKHAGDLFFHVQYKDYPFFHTHDGYWEFMLVTDGTILHRINGQTREIVKHTLCVIRPSDQHSIHNQKKQTSQHINLGVQSEYLRTFLAGFSPELYDKLVSAPPIEIKLKPALSDAFLRSAHLLLSSDGENYAMRLNLLFLDFIREIYSHLIKSETAKSNYSPLVCNLIHLFNDPKNMEESVETVIAKSNYSYPHAHRVFKTETGETPSAYFKRRKFEYAKKLMTETDMKLIDVALSIGYTSYAHFSTTFKNSFGVSPAEYAKDKENHHLVVEEI